MFQLFAAYRHAYLVAMFKPYVDAQSVMAAMPGTMEGVPHISGV